jgi:hypothetical protein
MGSQPKIIVSHLMFIFGNDKDIHDHPIKVRHRNTQREGQAEDKQRLMPSCHARFTFIAHDERDEWMNGWCFV